METTISGDAVQEAKKIVAGFKSRGVTLDSHRAVVAEIKGELANADFRLKHALHNRTTVFNQLSEAVKELTALEESAK